MKGNCESRTHDAESFAVTVPVMALLTYDLDAFSIATSGTSTYSSQS